MPARSKSAATKDSTANLGFEAKLWLAADKLRNNMDAAEPERSGDSQPQAARRASEARQYKHVVLGLIFLKYISDSFEEHHAKLTAGKGDHAGANPEDPDEYKAENIFWVPPAARWSYLQNSAKQPTIGKIVDDAMVAIERDNPRLKGVLPKDYARPGLDKQRLGELIDVIATIELTAASEGEKTHRSVDLLGRVYEYFLTRFASAEGKNGGTAKCEVRSASVEVKTSRPFVIRNSAFVIPSGPEHADTFRRDLHPDLRADTATRVSANPQPRSHLAGHLRSERQLLANPPFNDSDWFRKDDDVRWQFGVPPKGNANFAWVQHFIHHLAPQGMAGFVLANGSMSSNQSGEGDIRRALIEADLVDCMVALPGQLFGSNSDSLRLN